MRERLYTLREVAVETDTTIETVRRWVRDGRIPVERIGPLALKRVRVRRSVLMELFPHLKLVIHTQSESDPTDTR